MELTGAMSYSGMAEASCLIMDFGPIHGRPLFSGVLAHSSPSAVVVASFAGFHPELPGRRVVRSMLQEDPAAEGIPEAEFPTVAWIDVQTTMPGDGPSGLDHQVFTPSGEGWFEIPEYGVDGDGNPWMLMRGDVQLEGHDFDALESHALTPNGSRARLRMTARVPLACLDVFGG